jgi:hypothetical protein
MYLWQKLKLDKPHISTKPNIDKTFTSISIQYWHNISCNKQPHGCYPSVNKEKHY